MKSPITWEGGIIASPQIVRKASKDDNTITQMLDVRDKCIYRNIQRESIEQVRRLTSSPSSSNINHNQGLYIRQTQSIHSSQQNTTLPEITTFWSSFVTRFWVAKRTQNQVILILMESLWNFLEYSLLIPSFWTTEAGGIIKIKTCRRLKIRNYWGSVKR